MVLPLHGADGHPRLAVPIRYVMGYYSSFVVKVWVDDGGAMSRGQVQHVATRETVYFLSFDKLLEFMVSHLKSDQNEMAGPQRGGGAGRSTGDSG